MVYTFNMIHQLTAFQKSVITGSLLGDGSLSKPRSANANSLFSKKQAAKRREYINWHFEALKPYSMTIDSRFVSATKGGEKKYQQCVISTHCDPIFLELREKWYPNGIKIVPEDVSLDALAIAIWFCDDGDNCLRRRMCHIATCGFERKYCELLVSKLNRFGISSKVTPQNRLAISPCSYKDFIDLIKPHVVWDCFRYKVCYRDRLLNRLTDEETLAIYNMRKAGYSLKEVAKQFGVVETCVSAIANKKTKPHLWEETSCA